MPCYRNPSPAFMPLAIPTDATAANAGTRNRADSPDPRCSRGWERSSVADTGVPKAQRVSAVVACYKDAQAIPQMHRRLTDVFTELAMDYEIIFVNDGSPDDTDSVLADLT